MATSSADATSNVGQLSPISQVLRTLGITREDLLKRSAQMREFLNEGDYETAIASGASDIAQCGGPAEYGQSESQSESASAMSSGGCSKSQSTSASYTDASHSPAVKEEPCEAHLPSPRTTAEAENRGIGPPKDATTPADSKLANVERKLHAADASYTLPRVPMLTPSQSKYYRPHTAVDSFRPPSQAGPSTSTYTRSMYQYLSAVQILGLAPAPTTPHMSRAHSSSDLPPSSPPAGTPRTSPVRKDFTSSSVAPYHALPYTLPPGPYSHEKPTHPYAAIVGQAILSSLSHRLTLQEIYDWITIVYPYYKRGDTTWMNSIRHVLSTTVCFRKVPRERAIGRSLWAIWDEDLPCFEGGGFKKNKCKDIMDLKIRKEKSESPAKGKGKKRASDDDSESPQAKRTRKTTASADLLNGQVPVLQANPLFLPSLSAPMTHQQSYYERCVQQQPRPPSQSHVIFPLLPPSSPLSPSSPALRGASSPAPDPDELQYPSSPELGAPMSPGPATDPPPTDPPTSSALSEDDPILDAPSSPACDGGSSSVPGLTPHNSSSPPTSVPATDDISGPIVDPSIDDTFQDGANAISSEAEPLSDGSEFLQFDDDEEEEEEQNCKDGADSKVGWFSYGSTSEADGDETISSSSWSVFRSPGAKRIAEPPPRLHPVTMWGDTTPGNRNIPLPVTPPPRSTPLQASVEVLAGAADKARLSSTADRSTSSNAEDEERWPGAPFTPPSKLARKLTKAKFSIDSFGRPTVTLRRSTSEIEEPTTPPPRVKLSPVHTPISHKGVHMSPSTNLAHYKLNLDPPCPRSLGGKLPAFSQTMPPSTPPRPTFPFASDGATNTPRRSYLPGTPSTGGHGSGKFLMLMRNASHEDPFDAGQLLDGELSRRVGRLGDSPAAGLFARKSQLLYQSPSDFFGASQPAIEGSPSTSSWY